MGVGEWISQNWFNLFSAAGIIGGLWFTAVSLRSETKTRRVANLLTITANYREVWKEFFHSPELLRVIDPSADVVKKPVTPAEKYFVNMIISHTSSMYEALKDELVTKQDGLWRDVGSFLSLPIPQAVWEKTKVFQNADFVAFVEKCRRGGAFALRMLALVFEFGKNRGLGALHKGNMRQFAVSLSV
jgi:hypothetical protein